MDGVLSNVHNLGFFKNCLPFYLMWSEHCASQFDRQAFENVVELCRLNRQLSTSEAKKLFALVMRLNYFIVWVCDLDLFTIRISKVQLSPVKQLIWLRVWEFLRMKKSTMLKLMIIFLRLQTKYVKLLIYGMSNCKERHCLLIPSIAACYRFCYGKCKFLIGFLFLESRWSYYGSSQKGKSRRKAIPNWQAFAWRNFWKEISSCFWRRRIICF